MVYALYGLFLCPWRAKIPSYHEICGTPLQSDTCFLWGNCYTRVLLHLSCTCFLFIQLEKSVDSHRLDFPV